MFVLITLWLSTLFDSLKHIDKVLSKQTPFSFEHSIEFGDSSTVHTCKFALSSLELMPNFKSESNTHSLLNEQYLFLIFRKKKCYLVSLSFINIYLPFFTFFHWIRSDLFKFHALIFTIYPNINWIIIQFYLKSISILAINFFK